MWSHGVRSATPPGPAKRAAASVLLAALWALGPHVAIAQAATCVITNDRTGDGFRSLRVAVDAAQDADELEVRGLCVGSARVDVNIRLRGFPTAAHPDPTIDGDGALTVLRVAPSTRVVLVNLVVNHGVGEFGGGIRIGRGGLATLRGGAGVMNGRAAYGAGIDGPGATVRLYDRAFVSGGSATEEGGGIRAREVMIDDDASVLNNHAPLGGGISAKRVVLFEDAAVTSNVATSGGGGIYARRVFLANNADVSGNRVDGDGIGGGILSTILVRLTDSSSVFGNSAAHGGGMTVMGDGVILVGTSTVTGNEARTGSGGGILTVASDDVHPSVWLYDTASVTGNTAAFAGGGIATLGSVFACSPDATISPNDPDDPPMMTSCSDGH